MILLMRPHTAFFQNLTHVPCVSRAKCPMWVNCMRRQTPGLRYRAGFISRLCVCVCVLLHGWNVSRPGVYLSRSAELHSRLRAAAASNPRCLSSLLDFDSFKVLTPQTKYFHFEHKKKVPTCVFRLSTSLEEEDPRLTGGPCVSHTHTHTYAHATVPRIPLIFPGILFLLDCNFLPSLLFSFALMNVDPCDPLLRDTCRDSTLRLTTTPGPLQTPHHHHHHIPPYLQLTLG